MKKVCNKCGNEGNQQANFCEKCGGSYSLVEDRQGKKICNRCGSEGDSEFAFCSKCGEELGSERVLSNKSENRRSLILIGIPVAIVLLIVDVIIGRGANGELSIDIIQEVQGEYGDVETVQDVVSVFDDIETVQDEESIFDDIDMDVDFDGLLDDFQDPPREPIELEITEEMERGGLFDFQFYLAGNSHTLPLYWRELEAAGWNNFELYREIYPGFMRVSVAHRGQEQLDVWFANSTDEVITYSEAKIVKILSRQPMSVNNRECSLELPTGVRVGSTREEVLQIYGEPTTVFEGGNHTRYYYHPGGGSEISFRIEEGIVTSLGMTRHFTW